MTTIKTENFQETSMGNARELARKTILTGVLPSMFCKEDSDKEATYWGKTEIGNHYTMCCGCTNTVFFAEKAPEDQPKGWCFFPHFEQAVQELGGKVEYNSESDKTLLITPTELKRRRAVRFTKPGFEYRRLAAEGLAAA